MTDGIPVDRGRRPPIGGVVLAGIALVVLVGILVLRSLLGVLLHVHVRRPRDRRPSSSRWRRMRSRRPPAFGTVVDRNERRAAAARGSPVPARSTFKGIASPAAPIPAVPPRCCCSAAPTAARSCSRTACSFRPRVGRGKRFRSRTRRRCAQSSIRAPFRPPLKALSDRHRSTPRLRTESCGAGTCQVVSLLLPPRVTSDLAAFVSGGQAEPPPADLMPIEAELWLDPETGFPVRFAAQAVAGPTTTRLVLDLERLDPPPFIDAPVP